GRRRAGRLQLRACGGQGGADLRYHEEDPYAGRRGGRAARRRRRPARGAAHVRGRPAQRHLAGTMSEQGGRGARETQRERGRAVPESIRAVRPEARAAQSRYLWMCTEGTSAPCSCGGETAGRLAVRESPQASAR